MNYWSIVHLNILKKRALNAKTPRLVFNKYLR